MALPERLSPRSLPCPDPQAERVAGLCWTDGGMTGVLVPRSGCYRGRPRQPVKVTGVARYSST